MSLYRRVVGRAKLAAAHYTKNTACNSWRFRIGWEAATVGKNAHFTAQRRRSLGTPSSNSVENGLAGVCRDRRAIDEDEERRDHGFGPGVANDQFLSS